jgi:chemotaxis protein MotB
MINLQNISKSGFAKKISLVGLSITMLGGCVTQGSYDELMKERNALIDQNSKLAKNYAEEKGIGRQKSEESERLKQVLDNTSQELSASNEELASIQSKADEDKALYAKLVKELSGELDTNKITINKLKNGINVSLTEDILFASGSARIRKTGQDVLGKVGKQLEKVPYQIIVSGFTDNIPIKGKLAKRFPSNWDLAAARATSVVRLLEKNNVPSEKLIAASFGENQSVASNDTAEGREKNRRIEIRLRPVVEK